MFPRRPTTHLTPNQLNQARAYMNEHPRAGIHTIPNGSETLRYFLQCDLAAEAAPAVLAAVVPVTDATDDHR